MENFTRVAVAVPKTKLACPAGNAVRAAELFGQASGAGAAAVVFPALGLAGSTCGDLFFSPSLLEASEKALADFAARTASFPGVLGVVGLPVAIDGRIFDCAAAVFGGRVLGVVPRAFPSAARGARWFAPAAESTRGEIEIAGFSVPFGNDLVFEAGGAKFAVEMYGDALSVDPPAARLVSAGANVILCPGAEGETAGGADARERALAAESKRCAAAFAFANAGAGESATDMVFCGDSLVVENGETLARGGRFASSPSFVCADVDTEYLDFARSSNAAFRLCGRGASVRRVAVPGAPAPAAAGLARPVDPMPFVPGGDARGERCAEVLAIQSCALASRLEAIGCGKVVLGLSGGLDSTLALIVCVEAFARLGLPLSGIRAFTMPGFGTTSRTKGNAEKLCETLGIPLETIDITAMVRLHLSDLGRDETEKDVTYENAQARGRTYILMDKANQLGALLVGTGDLSELALGWCTYSGDHMSMYGVNGGVPKTLVKHIVRWYAGKNEAARETLLDIVDTPVSPELLPAAPDGTIAQETEGKIGPYELHDFFLYHFLRRGAGRRKIALLAEETFKGRYTADAIGKWLDVFFSRFRSQQFKRSCMPDGPAVLPAGLSPRGGWEMPSDVPPGWAPGAAAEKIG